MAALEEVRLRELEALSSLRAANESKLLPTADCMDLKVCVCLKAPMGAMLQCELCRDAFHSVCVRGPSGVPSSDQEEAWLCPQCRRSAKPPLDEVLPLLASLQRIQVRLSEGDALHHMVERTVGWQHRAREVSASYHLPEHQDRSSESPASPPRWPSDAQAPCLTPEWNKTSHAQTVFYTEQRCIPLQGLEAEVEELMVEGLLLQVSLPEVQQLYHVLLNRVQTHPTHGHPSPQDSDPSDCDAHNQCNSQGKNLPQKEDVHGLKKELLSGAEKKAKRRLERQCLEANRRDEAKKLQQNKRQKMNKEKNLERRATSTSSSPRSDSSRSDDDSDDELVMCPAESCQLPAGDEVDWVQCDGSCNQWFHQVCVGVSAELAEKEDYICVSCTIKDDRMIK